MKNTSAYTADHKTYRRQVAIPPPRVSRVRWMDLIQDHPDFVLLRIDSRRNLGRICWVLRAHARKDSTSAPTWERLIEGSGLSRATVARWLKWLRERGFLYIQEHGSTPAYGRRPPGSGNHATIYALTAPQELLDQSVEKSKTPKALSTNYPKKTPERAREDEGDFPKFQPAKTRRERLRLCERLRRELPQLRRYSSKRLRSALRLKLVQSWTLGDLLYAIEHKPDGSRWTYDSAVRDPLSVILWRLRLWEDHDAPSVEHERRRSEKLRLQERQRAQLEAVDAIVPSREYFHRLRSLARS